MSPEDIEQVSVSAMGFVSQTLVDNITRLIAQAWDEGYRAAIREHAYERIWDGDSLAGDNPYRTETR